MNMYNYVMEKTKKIGGEEMQYDSIILELMTRIKKLEDEMLNIKEILNERNNELEENNTEKDTPTASYTKTNEKMIDACYEYGKMAYENPDVNLLELARKVVMETNMNKNSAFIYICAIKNMLEGVVYKRAINANATRKYFDKILNDYGKHGLAKALNATALHIEYKKEFNLPTDTIESIYNTYSQKI